jgi:hypothetical protein
MGCVPRNIRRGRECGEVDEPLDADLWVVPKLLCSEDALLCERGIVCLVANVGQRKMYGNR